MAPRSQTASSPSPKRRRIDFGHDVTVLVGKPEQRFVAHKDVLCASSDFLRAACNGKWRETKDRIIQLPEQDARAFNIYLNWHYNDEVDLWDGDQEGVPQTNSNGRTTIPAGPRWLRLIQGYALGDMLSDSTFCDALIDSWFHLVEQTTTVPGNSNVNLIFELLPESSKLRQLIVHQLCFDSHPDGFSKEVDEYRPEVLKAVAITSVKESDKGIDEKRPRNRGKCFYHLHKDGEKSCKSKITKP